MNIGDKRMVLLLVVLTAAASVYAASPWDELTQMTGQLQQTPTDNALREQIIKLAHSMQPAPAVPEEARKFFVQGVTIVGATKDVQQVKLAIKAFDEALTRAPWWGDAYFNSAVAHDLANHFNVAEAQLKWYLMASPGEKEAREAQDRMYAIQARRDLYYQQLNSRQGGIFEGTWQLVEFNSREISDPTEQIILNITGSGPEGGRQYEVRLENFKGCAQGAEAQDGSGIVSKINWKGLMSDCSPANGTAWSCNDPADGYKRAGEELYCTGSGFGSEEGKSHEAWFERLS